jgi:hypothetical protein
MGPVRQDAGSPFSDALAEHVTFEMLISNPSNDARRPRVGKSCIELTVDRIDRLTGLDEAGVVVARILHAISHLCPHKFRVLDRRLPGFTPRLNYVHTGLAAAACLISPGAPDSVICQHLRQHTSIATHEEGIGRDHPWAWVAPNGDVVDKAVRPVPSGVQLRQFRS